MVLPFSWNVNENHDKTVANPIDKYDKLTKVISSSAPVRSTLADIYDKPDDSNSPRKRFHREKEKQEDNTGNCQPVLLPSVVKNISDKNNNNDNNDDNRSNNEPAAGGGVLATTKFSARHDELYVKPATEWHKDPEEDYKMSSRIRGLCLIVNNVQFDLDCFAQRKGSDKDAFMLKEIYKQLGFEVECKRNLTAEKMQNAFKHKSAMCMSKHDALVIILLSHGSETGIYGTDGIEVDLNDILSYFDNKKCKPMRGKPKVFIIQACRGRNVDYGVGDSQLFFTQPESQPNGQDTQNQNQQQQQSLLQQHQQFYQQFTQQNSQSTRLPRWTIYDKDHNPIRTDMLLCFSSQIGYVSIRNEEEGSWLGASLARHLTSEAHGKHLIEIFNMVSRDIRSRRSDEGFKQVLEITTIGFDRNLYFNPGLSE